MGLNEEQQKILDGLYADYKNNLSLTLNELQKKTGINRKFIGLYYKAKFDQDYLELVKLHSKTRKNLSLEHRMKISEKLIGKKKPIRSREHAKNLSLALKNRSYDDKYGDMAVLIRNKISQSNRGKKRIFNEIWRKNLAASLKGRTVWNRGKIGLQKAWNKLELPQEQIVVAYRDQNKTTERIARDYGVSRFPIVRILKNSGVGIRNAGEYFVNRTIEERYGKERADKIKKKISENGIGRKVTWGDKVSAGIKRHYISHPVSYERRIKMAEITRNLWRNKDYRERLIKRHRDRLKAHPEELDRLKRSQPIKISKVEEKMLTFLKSNFTEGEDFLFDERDSTGETLYRPDFQFPKQKVIIEIYGYYKHFTKNGRQRDKIREYYLKKAGWKVYKFKFLEIERNYLFEKTKETVGELLNGNDSRG